MWFSLIADCYEKIEATTKRFEMTDHLVALLKLTPPDIIEKVVYLTQGKLYPDFIDVQTGIAEKLALQAVSKAVGKSGREIEEDLAKTGDLGETAQKFLAKKTQATLFKVAPLTVEAVYGTLDRMARSSGTGSMTKKLTFLAGLLTSATPKEAKYIMRIVMGNMRLGIADMTVLDALAIAYGGGGEARVTLERAYNVSSDLGKVAKVVVEKGLKAVEKFEVSVGNPIRPMMAERLGSSEEILEKLDSGFMAEFKYDGERIQAHKQGRKVTLFSRRLENITDQYPDAVGLIQRHVNAEKAIVEAEAVAIDVDTNELKPFQELMHRRRKYGIKEAMKEYPISLFLFDLLYADGDDYTLKPYLVRHMKLEQIITKTDRVKTAESTIVYNIEDLESFFEKAVENGCEGLMCKSTGKGSVYQAGARGWMWIKYKREYKSEMTDTVDLVIIGAFHGRGKRAGTYGAFLLATYNPEKDIFETITKCGTGFTDEDLRKLPEIMNKHKIVHKHARVKSMLEANVWFEPAVVIEVMGAEITISPVHTCAMDTIRKDSGLAIRFPRFTGNYRLDKSAENATTDREIGEMYQRQLRKLKES
ncbi:MAG: ATP-dependent DNA ligase [Candidatus Bathyarchaeota archaeon]|nr:MAG: ATP-dependent DNA ligase [Candidatus Bathyarchaeota archaeon]